MSKRDERRKGMPRRPESLEGPAFQFAKEMSEQHVRDFKRGRGVCALRKRRQAVSLYQTVLSAEQAKRLGTSHRKASVVYQGVCDRCARLPDIDSRLDADIERWIASPGTMPVHDLGDLPLPESLGGHA